MARWIVVSLFRSSFRSIERCIRPTYYRSISVREEQDRLHVRPSCPALRPFRGWTKKRPNPSRETPLYPRKAIRLHLLEIIKGRTKVCQMNAFEKGRIIDLLFDACMQINLNVWLVDKLSEVIITYINHKIAYQCKKADDKSPYQQSELAKPPW